MTLPFSRDAFLDVFVIYNTTLWPVAAVLWLATLAAFVRFLSAHDRQELTFGLLAVQWAWSGVAYHGALFSRINPAAFMFAVLFVLEAGLLTWYGVVERRLPIRRGDRSFAWWTGTGMIAYGLLYPLIALVGDHAYPRVPTFGVPCPTTIVTAGFLLLVRPMAFVVAIIPLAWSVIGGSAAFLLGMRVDFALIVTGCALGAHAFAAAGRRLPT